MSSPSFETFNASGNTYFDRDNLVEYIFVGWNRFLSESEKRALIARKPHTRQVPIGKVYENDLVTVENPRPRIEHSVIGFDARRTEFTGAMLEIYRRALRETGYQANHFHNMVQEQGGFDTAMQLIHASRPSDGYTALWERGRLDLTVEAVVLRPEWADLFTDDDRRASFERLRQYEFAFPADSWHP